MLAWNSWSSYLSCQVPGLQVTVTRNWMVFNNFKVMLTRTQRFIQRLSLGQWFAMGKCCLWFIETPRLQSYECGSGHAHTQSVPPKVSVRFLRWNYRQLHNSPCEQKWVVFAELPIILSSAGTIKKTIATVARIWPGMCHTSPSSEAKEMCSLLRLISLLVLWKETIFLFYNKVLLWIHNKTLKYRFPLKM